MINITIIIYWLEFRKKLGYEPITVNDGILGSLSAIGISLQIYQIF